MSDRAPTRLSKQTCFNKKNKKCGNSLYGIQFWRASQCLTDGWMMADYEGLHGQILCFCGVTPLAGSGANDTQRFEQGARRNVAATHLAELSRF